MQIFVAPTTARDSVRRHFIGGSGSRWRPPQLGAPILVHLEKSPSSPQVGPSRGPNPCPLADQSEAASSREGLAGRQSLSSRCLKSCWGSWRPAPNPCPVTNAENAARATPSVTPSKSQNGSFMLRLWGSALSSKVSSAS